jgi:hypothetical protein
MNTGLYLYGIFPDPIPEIVDLQGLDKQPVHSQVVDGFSFLYSDACQEKYLASRRNLLTHEKVLELAMHEGFHVLLPLRFGLVVKDWETIQKQLIEPYKEQLNELFQKLTGQREVSIKILWDSKSELQAMMKSNQELKQQRDNMEGKNLNMEESDPMTEEMIYNAAFLIPWEAEPVFSERVEAIDQKFGDRLRIRYNNFTAPYTFAQLTS